MQLPDRQQPPTGPPPDLAQELNRLFPTAPNPESDALMQELLNTPMRIRFWTCTDHHRGMVQWRGDVAHCLTTGCGRTSDTPKENRVSPPIVPADPSHASPEVMNAIRAGHVAQVIVFCDRCMLEVEGDFIGESRNERLEAARNALARDAGWEIGEMDLCTVCAADPAIRVCRRHGDYRCCEGEYVEQPDGLAVHADDVERYQELLDRSVSVMRAR